MDDARKILGELQAAATAASAAAPARAVPVVSAKPATAQPAKPQPRRPAGRPAGGGPPPHLRTVVTAINRFVSGVMFEARQDPERVLEVYQEAQHRLRTMAVAVEDARAAQLYMAAANNFRRLEMEAAEEASVTTDDFSAQLAEAVLAYDAVADDAPHADLDREAVRRQIHEANDATRRTSILPRSAINARLGDTVAITFAPTQAQIADNIKQFSTVCLWQGTKEETQAITIDIDVVDLPPPDPTGTMTLRPYVQLEYGVDAGKTRTILLDVGRGQRLTVVANYVSVAVGMAAPPAGRTSGVMFVTAVMGFFAAPSQSPVIYTQYGVSDGSSLTEIQFVRPARASQLLPIGSTAQTGYALLKFYDSGNQVCYSRFVEFARHEPQQLPIPLTDEVERITVQDFSGSGTPEQFRLPFQLTL